MWYTEEAKQLNDRQQFDTLYLDGECERRYAPRFHHFGEWKGLQRSDSAKVASPSN
jgi:hypothetical protein